MLFVISLQVVILGLVVVGAKLFKILNEINL